MPATCAVLIVCPHCLTTNRVPDARLAEAPTCGQCKQELLPAAPVALDDASFEKVIAKTELPVAAPGFGAIGVDGDVCALTPNARPSPRMAAPSALVLKCGCRIVCS